MEYFLTLFLGFVALGVATIHSRSACKRDILELLKQERRMRGGNVDKDAWNVLLEMEDIIRKEI